MPRHGASLITMVMNCYSFSHFWLLVLSINTVQDVIMLMLKFGLRGNGSKINQIKVSCSLRLSNTNLEYATAEVDQIPCFGK